jgi:hypothetical protein
VKALWLVVIGAVVFEVTRGLFVPQLKALPRAAAEWKLVEQTTLQPSPRGALKAWHATYDGAPPITLTLHQMPWSPNSAWDAIQKWRTRRGAMAFAKGSYFGVAESAGADPTTLRRFVQGVTAALPPGSETFQ